eukprot:m.106639 g.106639  ORF g.106639 m.106639 type:complete len:720 (-) comp27740_c0_seq2:207-2366(-)
MATTLTHKSTFTLTFSHCSDVKRQWCVRFELVVISLVAMMCAPSCGLSAVPCDEGVREQLWALGAGITPGDSQVTSIKQAAEGGGCWEIEACATGDGAIVNCNWGCKPVPKNCASSCDCNGAWSSNSNGTITSVMDGKCIEVVQGACQQNHATAHGLVCIGQGGTVSIATCNGKSNQNFVFKAHNGNFIVMQGELCLQGAPLPPPPPPPCSTLKTEPDCVSALDKQRHHRCVWNATDSQCTTPPPPPPPQPCSEITTKSDCRWSAGPGFPQGRDCVWINGHCQTPPPPPPLPECINDHSCAHNGLSDVPPMGWRSWNLFAQHNDDSTMRAMMHALTDLSRLVDGSPTSLLDIGYISVGMDDGFQQCNCSTPQGPYPHSLSNVSCSVNDCRAGRCTWHNQSDGTPMIDTLRFPNLKGLVAYGHALRLSVGFYLNTCICMEKGRTYFEQDVAFLKEMDFDTVKIDQCGSAMNMSLWTALINATGKPMMSENCHNNPSWWSPGPTSADICDSNMWRSGGDIGNGFEGALSELHQGMKFEKINASNPWGPKPLSRPGCWAYPDMMEVGNFCDTPDVSGLCFTEERSHMGMWCIVSSPLVLGFNMSDSDRMDRVWPIITNREAIAVNHAWADLPGTLHKTLLNDTIEIWSKPLPSNQVAILMINVGSNTTTVTLSTADDVPGQPRGTSYRSIWDKATKTIVKGNISVTLTKHDSLFAVFSNTSS